MSRYYHTHRTISWSVTAAGKRRVTDLAAKHGLAEDEIRAMVEFDPTSTDKFLGWIAAQVADGELSIPADGPELRALLEDFQRKGRLIGEPDIDKWTFSGLKDRLSVTESKGEVDRAKVEEGQRIIHDAPPFPGVAWNWKVIEITTPEAASKLLRPEWCIKDRKYWDEYGLGPDATAYLILRDDEKYACMVPNKGEIKNTDDKPLAPTKVFGELLKKIAPQMNINWNGEFAPFEPFVKPIEEVAADAGMAYFYAKADGERWLPGEAAIAADAEVALEYAIHIVKGRWPDGEPEIARDPGFAYFYAVNVVKRRWPDGEAAIATDAATAGMYAANIVKGRWPDGEAAIATNPQRAFRYAVWIVKGRWADGEAAIATDPELAYGYAKHVVKGRWPDGEAAIAGTGWAGLYSDIVGGSSWADEYPVATQMASRYHTLMSRFRE